MKRDEKLEIEIKILGIISIINLSNVKISSFPDGGEKGNQ